MGAPLVVSQVETAGKKSMDFFDWQDVRRPHGEPCNDEQRSQAEKDAIYSRRFSLDWPLALWTIAHLPAVTLQIVRKIRWTNSALSVARYGIVNELWVRQIQVCHD